MALGTFIAGSYTGTYTHPAGQPVTLGITKQGYNIGLQHTLQNIDESDAYGRTLIEQIYQGTNATIDFEPIEWLVQVLRALSPFQTTGMPVTGAGGSVLGTIGMLSSDRAGVLILSATAGTPAATAPASLTASYAIIHENFDARWTLGPNHRTIPLRFRLLPYSSTGIRHFSVT